MGSTGKGFDKRRIQYQGNTRKLVAAIVIRSTAFEIDLLTSFIRSRRNVELLYKRVGRTDQRFTVIKAGRFSRNGMPYKTPIDNTEDNQP